MLCPYISAAHAITHTSAETVLLCYTMRYRTVSGALMYEQTPPTHRVRRATAAGSAQRAAALLVLLHGYGSNEHDLFGLAAAIDPRVTVVSLRAPLTLTPGSYAWFTIDFTDTGLTLDLPGGKRALAQLAGVIVELARQYAADPARVFLGGFSQGAAMAAAAALLAPDTIAGAIILSGITPVVFDLALPASTAQTFFVAHGTHDPVVPLASGHATRDLLGRMGADLSYHEYAMGHTISDACLRDMVGWLDATLALEDR